MTRASLELMQQGDPGDDIRVPITHALLQIYGNDVADAELFNRVAAMLEIEAQPQSLRQVERAAG